MAEVSEYDAWMVARDGWEARFRAEGVAYLAYEFSGVRFIAPLGSPVPPGIEAETVMPSEEMLARVREVGRGIAP